MWLRCPWALVWSLCCALLSLRGLVLSAGASEPPAAGSEQDPVLDLGRALETGSRPAPASGDVTFNLERVDLAELTRHIALTKRRFIYDGRKLSGIEASVVSPSRISVEEAFAAYLAVLEMHALSVVQQGEFWKIVEGPLVGTVPPLHDEHAPLPPGALPITHLHRVEHAPATPRCSWRLSPAKTATSPHMSRGGC